MAAWMVARGGGEHSLRGSVRAQRGSWRALPRVAPLNARQHLVRAVFAATPHQRTSIFANVMRGMRARAHCPLLARHCA